MHNGLLPRQVKDASIPPLDVPFVYNYRLLLHQGLLLLLHVASVRLLGVPVSSGVRVPTIVVIAGLLFTSKSGCLIGWSREVCGMMRYRVVVVCDLSGETFLMRSGWCVLRLSTLRQRRSCVPLVAAMPSR